MSKYGLLSEKNRENLENVYVQVKIVEIKKCDEEGQEYFDEHFAQQITTANNTQNQVNKRDFVAFDPVQRKIANDLSIIGVKYHVSRSENAYCDESNFTVEEAVEALSYAKDIDSTILISREPSLIYSDLSHSRYKKLFNPSITSYYVWNCVNILRELKKCIKEIQETLTDESLPLITYGDGVLLKTIFDRINIDTIGTSNLNWKDLIQSINIPDITSKSLRIIQDTIASIAKPIINIFKSPNDIKEIYQKINDFFGTDKKEVEVEFSIANVEGLKVIERRKLEFFVSKFENDDVALEAFKIWATKLYSASNHEFGYKSNIHHYLKQDGKTATETFILRIAYYSKLIVSFEHHNYGYSYKSILFNNPEFEKWANENLDENMKIVVDSEDALEKVSKLEEFIIRV